jgi:hypothetical protein
MTRATPGSLRRSHSPGSRQLGGAPCIASNVPGAHDYYDGTVWDVSMGADPPALPESTG